MIKAAFLDFGVPAADLDPGDLARDYVAGCFTESLRGLRSFRGQQFFGTEDNQRCYDRPGHQVATLLHRRPFTRSWARRRPPGSAAGPRGRGRGPRTGLIRVAGLLQRLGRPGRAPLRRARAYARTGTPADSGTPPQDRVRVRLSPPPRTLRGRVRPRRLAAGRTRSPALRDGRGTPRRESNLPLRGRRAGAARQAAGPGASPPTPGEALPARGGRWRRTQPPQPRKRRGVTAPACPPARTRRRGAVAGPRARGPPRGPSRAPGRRRRAGTRSCARARTRGHKPGRGHGPRPQSDPATPGPGACARARRRSGPRTPVRPRRNRPGRDRMSAPWGSPEAERKSPPAGGATVSYPSRGASMPCRSAAAPGSGRSAPAAWIISTRLPNGSRNSNRS